MLTSLALVTVSLLAQGAPSSDAVVVSVVWPGVVAPATANRIEELVKAALIEGHVVLAAPDQARERAEAQRCGVNQACLAAMGKRRGARVVVRIEPAAVARDVAILLQAVEVAQATVLTELNVTVPAASLDAALPGQLQEFVKAVRLETTRAVSAVDRPQASPGLTPPPEPPRESAQLDRAVAAEGWPVQKTVGLVGGGAGVLTAGAGLVVFAAAGGVTKDAQGYVQQDQASRVPAIQQQQAIGVALMVAGGAVAVAGAVLWATSPSQPALTLGVGPGSVLLEGRW